MKKGSKHTIEAKLKNRKAHIGKGIGNQNGFKKGQTSWNKGLPNNWSNLDGLKMGRGWNKGKKTPLISIKKMVERRKKDYSYVAWNKGKKAPQLNGNTNGFKKGQIPWNKDKPFIAIRGEKNVNWKNGATPQNRKDRISLEYKLWRKVIFTRDNFTCQKYGIRGGILRPHHINNFADYIELRFAIDNGITLSEKAHHEFHGEYGYKNNTKEQLEEFLNTYDANEKT